MPARVLLGAPPHIVAGVLAGALLSGIETVYALASGSFHSPGYLAACGALTLLASWGLVSLVGLSHRLRGWAVALWVGMVFWIVDDAGSAIPAFVLFKITSRLVGQRSELWIDSIIGAIAVVFALSTIPRFAEEVALPFANWIDSSAGVTTTFAVTTVGLFALVRVTMKRSALICFAAVTAIVVVPALVMLRSTLASPYTHFIGGPAPERRATAPSIMVVILDTVRADHLSIYGATRQTTPNLEALLRGRDGHAIFGHAFANSPWTVPSHASLVTGVLPSAHGAHHSGEPNPSRTFRLVADATLTERLHDAGYYTVGVVANWLGTIEGFPRGFVRLLRPKFPLRLQLLGEKLRKKLLPGLCIEARIPYPAAATITDVTLEEMEACGAGSCFVLVNYLDAHSPYIPSQRCRGRFGPPWSIFEKSSRSLMHDPSEEQLALLADRYDEELCDLDRELTRLLKTLERRGMVDDWWVFITSDHGEALGEHGDVGHGSSVYNEQVRIPLIVLPPSGRSVEVTEAPVSLLDITATVVEVTGIEPVGVGRSLLRHFDDREAQMELFPRVGADADAGDRKAGAAAIVAGPHKLIRVDEVIQLFDLAGDPTEEIDRAAIYPQLVSTLTPRLPPLLASPDRATSPETILSPRDRDMLHELGYID